MPYLRNKDRGLGDIEDARDNKSDTHPSVNPAAKKHRTKKRVSGAGKVRIAISLTKKSPKRTHKKKVSGK